MSEKKSVSDIIVDLNDKVDNLSRIIRNQDNNIKLILKKINSIDTSIKNQAPLPLFKGMENLPPSPPRTYQEPQVPTQPVVPERKFAQGADAVAMKVAHAQQENKSSRFEAMKAQAGIDDDDFNEPQGFGSLGPNGGTGSQLGLEAAKSFVGSRRGARVDRVQVDAKIKVSQTVFDSSGKHLALATVKIMNSLGQTVKSARSGSKGVWKADLNPGNYNIHVLKSFVTEPDRKPVEMKYSISVPNTGGTSFEVPSKILED